MKDRRLGYFYVLIDLIDNEPGIVKRLMSKVIVVRAELMWDRSAIQYTAQCDDFEEMPIGNILPNYVAIFHKSEDGQVTFEGWERD